MKHFIVMVFNLQWRGEKPTYIGNPSWLEIRLNIFEKYCLNAWKNQTDPDFYILMYCDPTTSPNYKNRFLELEKKHKFIKINWEFSKGPNNYDYDIIKKNEWESKFKKSILTNIKSLLGPNTNEFICSRFENDDIPEVRYNEFIKLAHQQYDIISIGKGLYWDINNDIFLDSTFPQGPFVSVKSNLDNFLSPQEDQHHDYISKKGGTPIITEENLWIQLVHGGNLWNRIDRMPGHLIEKPSNEYFKTHFAL